MPSKSKKQHNLMALVANDPAASKRLGIPKKVGKDFMEADKERGKAALRKLPKKVATKRGNKWRPATR